MRPLILVVGLLAPLAASLPVHAQDATMPAAGTVPITAAIAAVSARFAGQIVAADLKTGHPGEGVDIVYEFRLLTPLGDILKIRVDAYSGQILQVDGRGLVDARKRP